MASCKNARLPTCKSGDRFLGAIFQLIFVPGAIPQFKVLKNLPWPPTSHVANPDESLWCWDCPHNPGLGLRTGTQRFWSTWRPRCKGRCVSSLTLRLGLRPTWMGTEKDLRCTGTDDRRALYRHVHTERPWRSWEVSRLGLTPRNFVPSQAFYVRFIIFFLRN